jgi:hypothetical protein
MSKIGYIKQLIRVWRKAVRDGETKGLTKRQFCQLVSFQGKWNITLTPKDRS